MSEDIKVMLRLEALKLATEGASDTCPIPTILEIANDYYNFLKGTTNE